MVQKYIPKEQGKEMKKILVLILICVFSISLYSQGSAGSETIYQPKYIIDMPTAGILPVKTYSVNGSFFANGGVLLDFDISPLKNLSIGLSFSGSHIWGSGNIIFQNLPGINFRWRILDETKKMPAILIGFSNQGRGMFYKQLKRFQTMSPGIYAAASKSFTWWAGYFALHAGVNYTFEQPSGYYIPNLWMGVEHSIGKRVSLHIEFNPNLADSQNDVMSNRILLNASLRWSIVRGATIEFIMHDLFNHTINTAGFERWFGLEFTHGI